MSDQIDLDGECIHGLGPVEACSICNGTDERLRRKEEQRETWRYFPAKFAGVCRGCLLPIAKGELIAWREGSPTYHKACQP